MVKNLFEIDEITSDELEDELLEAENLYIFQNNKKLLVSIVIHSTYSSLFFL